jgi:hypothetical protein
MKWFYAPTVEYSSAGTEPFPVCIVVYTQTMILLHKLCRNSSVNETLNEHQLN